jgi:phosphatidylinositol alpha-1,6-mannosyltransferase
MRLSRVLLVTNNFPPVRGGSAVVYGSLARFAGGRVIAVAPRRSYADGLPLIGWREHDRCAPYRVVRLPLLRTLLDPTPNGWQRLVRLFADTAIRVRLAAMLLSLIVAEGTRAVCIGELVASGWIVTLLRWVPGVRVVIYVHGEEITTADPYDRDANRRRRTLLAADGIVAVSRFTQTALRRLLGAAARQNIILIENGVDTERFTPRSRRPDLVARYQLAKNFVFVSVCRLLEKKGLDQAIRAFAVARCRHPACRYLIVGSGPYRATLERIAMEEGVAVSVEFAGEVSDQELADHYCLGDAFIMPNRRLENGDTEGFGLVFLEANASGLPVIAGQDGGSTDAVRHGVNGLVVDGRSVAAIARAMLALIEEPALRARLRAAGLAAARQAGWAGKAEQFVRLCLGEAPAPRTTRNDPQSESSGRLLDRR